MDPVDSGSRRSRADRAKWIVGTSAVAATLLLTGVVAAQGSADEDPATDEAGTTAEGSSPSSWLPRWGPAAGGTGDLRPGEVDEHADDDDWSSDGGGDLVPSAPSGSADTSSHSS